MKKQAVIRKFFSTWTAPLGLAWWHIDVLYYDDPAEIVKRFATDLQDGVVLARTYADWRYATANIHINTPAFDDLTDDEIERVVLHELCHILVNEMQEGEKHHEERVVTGLQKAFMWTRSAFAESNKPTQKDEDAD